MPASGTLSISLTAAVVPAGTPNWAIDAGGTGATLSSATDTNVTVQNIANTGTITLTVTATGTPSSTLIITVVEASASGGLVSIFFGNGTGDTSFANDRLTITGGGAGGIGTNATGNFHLLYVDTPIPIAYYDAEVDIVVANSSLGVSDGNSVMGFAIIRGDPATQTRGNITYYLLAHRSAFPSQPNTMRKSGTGTHNIGSALSGSSNLSGATIQTLGFRRATNVWRPEQIQIVDGGAPVSAINTNEVGFTNGDDVYIGLMVASNTTAVSTLVISGLRYKTSATGDWIVVDLNQSITTKPATQ